MNLNPSHDITSFGTYHHGMSPLVSFVEGYQAFQAAQSCFVVDHAH